MPGAAGSSNGPRRDWVAGLIRGAGRRSWSRSMTRQPARRRSTTWSRRL